VLRRLADRGARFATAVGWRRWLLFAALVALAALARLVARQSGDSSVLVYGPRPGMPHGAGKVAVPRLVDQSFQVARDFSWEHALVLVEIWSDRSARGAGVVVDQLPWPEMRVRSGDTITVTVSLGPAGAPLPPDPRVGERVPLRLTPIGIATVRVRQTQAARRRTGTPASSPQLATVALSLLDATPTLPGGTATRRARLTAAVAGGTETVTTTVTPTRALAATPTAPTPTAPPPEVTPDRPVPTSPPGPTGAPANTAVPEPPTPVPPPPEPPTPVPPPPESGGRGDRRGGAVFDERRDDRHG